MLRNRRSARSAGCSRDDLGRAAADIEDQRALVFAPDQGRAAQRRQIGLLLGGNHLQARCPLRRGRGRSGHRHWRPAAPPGWRWRGHGATPAAGDVLGADFQRGDGALHRGSEISPVVATPSPSRTMREKESTARNRPGHRPGDQKPAIVGAQIQHRQHRRGLRRRRGIFFPLYGIGVGACQMKLARNVSRKRAKGWAIIRPEPKDQAAGGGCPKGSPGM